MWLKITMDDRAILDSKTRIEHAEIELFMHLHGG
jgi:hypothetical protein